MKPKNPIQTQHIRLHPKTKPLAERFWAKVDKSGGPDACWPWTRHHESKPGAMPYGIACFCKHKNILAHRLAWMLHNNTYLTSRDDCVLHKCDNPSCCNPSHLFLGSRADNIRDMDLKGRRKNNYGEANGAAKLKATDIPKIRALRKKKFTLVKIAKLFGVNFGTIHKVCKGKTWKKGEANARL